MIYLKSRPMHDPESQRTGAAEVPKAMQLTQKQDPGLSLTG